MAMLFCFFKKFKKSLHSTATELFFMFLKKEKNKPDWVGYIFPIPLNHLKV